MRAHGAPIINYSDYRRKKYYNILAASPTVIFARGTDDDDYPWRLVIINTR